MKRKQKKHCSPSWMSRDGSDRINGDRINALFHLLIHRVFWDSYNPLILTIDPDFRPGTSKCTMVCFFKTLPADGGRVPWFFLVKRKPKAPRFWGSQFFPISSYVGCPGTEVDGSLGSDQWVSRSLHIHIYIVYMIQPPEGEKFPVIALDYQHRRSASALFV